MKIHALQVHEAAGSAGWTTLSDEVRHKPHKERAWEEKKWVGLDVMVNAGKYLHVTELEAEDMKYDPAYRTTLSTEDVRRMLILPEQLSLSLPFLRTPDEVEAHKLVQTYTFNRGVGFFSKTDVACNDLVDTDAEHVTEDERREAQLRDLGVERLNAELARMHCWRLRRKPGAASGLPEDECRTLEDEEWLAIDMVMHPRMFRRRALRK